MHKIQDIVKRKLFVIKAFCLIHIFIMLCYNRILIFLLIIIFYSFFLANSNYHQDFLN